MSRGLGLGLMGPREGERWGLKGVGWVCPYGSISDGVRGQLQQGGGHAMESHLCAVSYGDVRIVSFPSLAMDGTEIRIHQLHDLSQLW